MDQRDEQSWIIVELNRQGELKVEDGTLASTLRRDLSVDDDFPVFVPSITYKKAGRQITVHLMEGYCFVGNGLTDVEYYALGTDLSPIDMGKLITAMATTKLASSRVEGVPFWHQDISYWMPDSNPNRQSYLSQDPDALQP